MDEQYTALQDRINDLILEDQLKEKLLDQLEEISQADDSSQAIGGFVSQLEVLEEASNWQKLRAQISELDENYEQLVENSKKDLLEIIKRAKTDEEKEHLEGLRKQLEEE